MSGAHKLRTVIVDDEPLALELLRDLLRCHGDIELVGEAEDGESALETLRSTRPDLVFLDIRMPEKDGFSVLRELPAEHWPHLVFVTAFDRYAVQAFDIAAVDYLLKPYDQQRLDLALERVRQRRSEGAAAQAAHSEPAPDPEKLLETLQRLSRRRHYPQRLFLKVADRTLPQNVADIRWIEARGKLVRLHVGGRQLDVRDSLKRFELDVLDPERFIRISRSAIIHIDHAVEIQRWFHGELVVLLDDGSKVTTTRNYRERLERAIEASV